LAPPLDRFTGIDRANAERLKRGLHKIDAPLGSARDESGVSGVVTERFEELRSAR